MDIHPKKTYVKPTEGVLMVKYIDKQYSVMIPMDIECADTIYWQMYLVRLVRLVQFEMLGRRKFWNNTCCFDRQLFPNTC